MHFGNIPKGKHISHFIAETSIAELSHSEKWELEITEFVTFILVNDSFFCSSFFVPIIEILQFVHLFFLD